MLGLLAFMLAFTFGIASFCYDTRRELVGNEANAVSTTYLRANLVTDQFSTKIKQILSGYTAVRAQDEFNPDKLMELTKNLRFLQDQLWEQSTAISKIDKTPICSLLISTVNELVDLHAKRVDNRLIAPVPQVFGMRYS